MHLLEVIGWIRGVKEEGTWVMCHLESWATWSLGALFSEMRRKLWGRELQSSVWNPKLLCVFSYSSLCNIPVMLLSPFYRWGQGEFKSLNWIVNGVCIDIASYPARAQQSPRADQWSPPRCPAIPAHTHGDTHLECELSHSTPVLALSLLSSPLIKHASAPALFSSCVGQAKKIAFEESSSLGV